MCAKPPQSDLDGGLDGVQCHPGPSASVIAGWAGVYCVYRKGGVMLLVCAKR